MIRGTPKSSFSVVWPLVVAVFMIGGGCTGASNSTGSVPVSPSTSDRFADLVDDERETVVISPVEQDASEYQIMPASFDTVIVRAVPAQGNQPRSVEALLKGSFPDGCTNLHEMTQSKTASGQSVTLTMRRPAEAFCTQVVRPYRFFFELDDRYGPGAFELVVNDRTFPFAVE